VLSVTTGRALDRLEYLTARAALTKLTGVGRHVSSERRRSLRGRILLALLAIAVLICVAAFAAYQIWDQSRPAPGDRPPSRHGRTTASAVPVSALTLTVTVTGPKCQVFVQVPGGDILVNRSLVRGESVRFDERQLSVVLGDASAAQVYVNGRLRPAGKPGQRVTFTALKG
jgi:ferric-dicitrate binding protein FerR (iron transport regulator)